ncbi:hypothetical protein NDI56_20135 [Haloarcula sp. S1CR25-12]|uniref:Uncharacterized protein n=1 Tax=Haloarcula saliterrae TaxID=2950534 RepID=A0ABU2FHJ3_9EURY|nr:hypothetical protein [Haloarcula sp. S1CR25-12]MDS0261716.1 hypothetical protein [Haloarcula sp. S1CR25-12]
MATVGAFIPLIGKLVFIWNLLQSRLEEPKIEDGDPWNLERDGMLDMEWTWFDCKLETDITDGGEDEEVSALTDVGEQKDD